MNMWITMDICIKAFVYAAFRRLRQLLKVQFAKEFTKPLHVYISRDIAEVFNKYNI